MNEAARPAMRRATPPRAETFPALLLLGVGAAAPPVEVAAGWEALPLAEPVVGVKGAVIPKPGSLALGTLAAKAAKVLSPVVGGLMAPYMPPLQCGALAQKNQMGLAVWVTSRVKTPIWPEAAS